MDERFELIKNTIAAKITTILLCGILCAGLLVVEKAFFTKFTIQAGGPVSGEYIVSVFDTKDRSNPKKQLNYPALMHSDANLTDFIKLLEKEGQFEFVKLNPNWTRLTDVQKNSGCGSTYGFKIIRGTISVSFIICLKEKSMTLRF